MAVDTGGIATELATEVKIPISDCYIALGVPSDYFKPEPERSKQLGVLQLELQVHQGMLTSGVPQIPDPQGRAISTIQEQSAIQQIQQMIAQLSAPIHPQVFLVETYRLTTQRTATGKGELIGSVVLDPGQEAELVVTRSATTTTEVTSTTTAMESEEAAVSDDFNKHVSAASEKSGSRDTLDYNLHGNFHGDASVTVGGGEANAKLDVIGGSNAVRDAFSTAVANALDTQRRQTAASRRQSISTGATGTTTTTSEQIVQREHVKNPNPTHAVTLQRFQVVEQFTSFLSLVDVQVAFKTTDSQHVPDRVVPLTAFDGLLKDVIVPERVTEIKERIKLALTHILDYQNEPTSIVEEVPNGAGETMLRLKRDLSTTYVLKDVNGKPVRDIQVNGLLLKVYTNNLASPGNPIGDLVVGEHSALGSQ